jgi:membrane protease YdiL (CAAX protease family)
VPRRAADPSRDLLTSLVLVFPLLIIYQVGVLFTLPMLNGADFLTTFLFHTVGLNVRGYLVFVGAVVLLFAVAMASLRHKQHFNPKMVLPVLLESSVYALTMGSLIVLVMTKLLHISPRLAASLESQGMLTRLVMSVGAGVYEELVFRLGLLGGLAWVFHRVLGAARWAAVLAAFALSAAAFSAVHHLPPYGDPFTVGIFTFRLLAGVFFGLLFWFRGFAVAVYTHALYDVYVLLVR